MARPLNVPLSVTLDEAIYLMNRLSKMPFDEVAALLPKLKAQTDAAAAAAQKAGEIAQGKAAGDVRAAGAQLDA